MSYYAEIFRWNEIKKLEKYNYTILDGGFEDEFLYAKVFSV